MTPDVDGRVAAYNLFSWVAEQCTTAAVTRSSRQRIVIMAETAKFPKAGSWSDGRGGLGWLTARTSRYESITVPIEAVAQQLSWGGLVSAAVALAWMSFGEQLGATNYLTWCLFGGDWPGRALLLNLPLLVRVGLPSLFLGLGLAAAVLTEGFKQGASRLQIGSFLIAVASYLLVLPAVFSMLVVAVNIAVWAAIGIIFFVVVFSVGVILLAA